ncbi:MAG: hypothetical protein EGQ40_03115 [Clostridiales bacterium]|nr:hypothetical protein [Clostridiales bacterium]
MIQAQKKCLSAAAGRHLTVRILFGGEAVEKQRQTAVRRQRTAEAGGIEILSEVLDKIIADCTAKIVTKRKQSSMAGMVMQDILHIHSV